MCRKEPVQEVDSQVEGLCAELVLLSDLSQPIHQNGPHAFCDVWLFPHVAWPWACVLSVWGESFFLMFK